MLILPIHIRVDFVPAGDLQLLKDALHVRLHRVDGNAHQRGDFLVAATLRGKHGNRKLVGCERVGHLQRRHGVVNFHPPAAEAVDRLHNLVVRFRLLLAQRALHLPLQNAVMLHKRVDVPLAAGDAPRGIELLLRAFILLQAHANHAQDDVEVDAVNGVARARHQQGGFGNAHRVFVFAPDVTNSAGSMIVNPGKFIATAVASLTQPLFNKGANIAQLKIAKAQQEEAKLSFQQALLNAGSEVNEALVKYQTARDKSAYYDKQINSLNKALESTSLLMQHGNTTYLEVLTAQQTLLNAELTQVANRFTEMQGVINLYQALGGGRD